MKQRQVRNELLQVASRLFYEQGYHATGINQIIAEAGVAKASFYQHFPSKEDLLEAYLAQMAQDTRLALGKLVEQETGPAKRVAAIFDFLERSVQHNAFKGCNFLNIAGELPRDNKRIHALIREQKNDVRQVFRQAIKPSRKTALADELYLLFEAALTASKIHESDWAIKTAREMALKRI